MKKAWIFLALFIAAAAPQAGGAGDAFLSENFRLETVAPRIFAPAEGSAAVNRVRFTFANPDNCAVTIRVYDLSSALVKRTLERESDTVMFWDGTDNSGAVVRSGIYIYQIEAGAKVVSGTVIVAQ
jgi:hypothetical protein